MNKIILALLLLTLAACQSTGTKEKPTTVTTTSGKETNDENLETFSNDEFSIQYPKNWELNTSGQMGTSIIIYTPLEKDDMFRENVNVMLQDLSASPMTMDEYIKLSEDQIKSLITDAAVIESKRETIHEAACHKLVYSGKQGAYDLQFEQYIWIKNNKAFIATLTCEKETFDKYHAAGEAVLQSMKLK